MATKSDLSPTQRALKQEKPFRSLSQEAVISLLLTTESIRWPFTEFLAGHDLTHQQYNVLRILRGAGAGGLPTLDIVDRLIERTPGVTRLIDRLEAKGLVVRQRSNSDRRQVFCRITKDGLDLLASLDGPIGELDDQSLARLSRTEQKELLRLLDKVRDRGE